MNTKNASKAGKSLKQMRQPPEQQNIRPVGLEASYPMAPVLVYNCTAFPLSGLLVNKAQFAPTAGVAGISSPGIAPGFISVPRVIAGGSPPAEGFISGSGGSQVAVDFFGTTAWTEAVYINQLPNITMFLWCYVNGFILMDQNGKVSQLFAQAYVPPIGGGVLLSLPAGVDDEYDEGVQAFSVRF